MNLVEEIARNCCFDYGEIIAEVLCPDYEGPEVDQMMNAFNKLPQEVRIGIVDAIRKHQLQFTQAIVRECVDVVNEVGGEPARWINRNIEKKFGW